jgi:hypothetical protein
MNLPDCLTRDADEAIRPTGRRIGLLHLIDVFNEEPSSERLYQEFSDLPTDLIDQVLAFYDTNRPEVDAYVARCHEAMDQHYAEHRPGPGVLELRRLRDRLEGAGASRENLVGSLPNRLRCW